MQAVLFLVAPFYYHPNIGGEGLRIPNNITVWMMATIIIGYSLHLVLKRPTFVIPKYFAYIAAFPILITLSGFVTGVEQPLTWLFRLLFIWGGLAFFFSMFQHGLKQGRLDRILFIIVVSALLQGLVGVAQIWLQSDMPFWLPKSPNGVPSGLFQQINNQATYQVTAIMIVAYLITRPFISFAQPWLKAALILAVLCASFLVTVSGSRIGALTLFLGLLIIIPSQWQRFKQRKKIALMAVVALVIGISGGSVVGNSHMIDKTTAMQSGYSGESRIGIYTIALDLINQEPVFGHGIGSFGRVFQYARPDFYAKHPDAVLPNQFVSHPHNEVFFWLVEGGLIAGVGLLAVLLGVILALKKLGWQRGGAYAAILLPIGLHTQVELPFYISLNIWLLFLILIFCVLGKDIKNNKLNITESAKNLLKISAIAMIVISNIFLVHTAMANMEFINLYEEIENPDAQFLHKALENPYLNATAVNIDMDTVLYTGIVQKNARAIRLYIDWAEKSLIEKPHIATYLRLIDAYKNLKEKSNVCRTATNAQAIYFNHPIIVDLKRECESSSDAISH
jgi:O-antigen polymerase